MARGSAVKKLTIMLLIASLIALAVKALFIFWPSKTTAPETSSDAAWEQATGM